MLLVIMHELDIFDRRDICLLNRALDHVPDGIFIPRIQIAHYRFYHFIRYVIKPQTCADFRDNPEEVCL